ncbi:MAG: carbohydrate kinase family protein [Candidatus Humimicrobiaceae bacterium]
MYDVITVGSNTIDAFAYTDRSESICIKTIDGEECYISYPTGSKLLIDELHFSTGGGGTNTAATFSKMGLSVGYVGKIGSDDNGRRVLQTLKDWKIDFVGAISSDTQERTGYSIILDSIERRRTILAYKGVNNDLDFREIDSQKLETKWFYLCSMVGKSFKALEDIALFARKKRINVLFNPSNYQAEKGEKYLAKILRSTKVLVLNKEEAAHLVGKGEPKEKLVKLRKTGPKIVIITDGKNPIHCVDENLYYIVYPMDIKVVEATGAGDSFGSGFLAAYILTGEVGTSLKVGLANSQSVLKYKGAKSKILTFDEAKEYISKNEIILKKSKI